MVGRTLTHYKVVAEIGAGGMGVVYKALDLRLDRYVALKILPPEKGDEHDRRSRFLHEARAASALNDPHIVTIFDIFTDEGTHVLVMELVQGRTLRDILNDGPIPVARAIDIALQVAEGVATAHTAGIVHRDLKPGNVMVTERGRVKILDFGLAKLVGGSFGERSTTMAPTTIAGTLLGTVDYMSPEQAKGDPIDRRSDVFSLGAMLYEMLTGARPFVAGHPLGVLHEILYGAIVPPRAKRADVTPEIETIVLRALERDREQRYQSMESLATDLRRAQRSVEATFDRVAASAPPISPPPLPRHAPPPNVLPDVASGSTRTNSAHEWHHPQQSPPEVHQTPRVAERVSSIPVGPSVPDPAAVRPASRRDAPPARQKANRAKGRRRPRWVPLMIVFGVIYSINAARHTFDPAPPRAPRPRVAGERQPSRGDQIGTAVEKSVADALDAIGPTSPAIQLARANMYWQRAQKNRDAALMKKAEDTYNEVLQLKPDRDQETEAREGLRQIAAAKETLTQP